MESGEGELVECTELREVRSHADLNGRNSTYKVKVKVKIMHKRYIDI